MRFFYLIFCFCYFNTLFGQVTLDPFVLSTNHKNTSIKSVEILPDRTIVTLNIEQTKPKWAQSWIRIASNTYMIDLKSGDKYRIIELNDGLLLDQQIPLNGKIGAKYTLQMVFGSLMPGSRDFHIIEPNGFEWKHIRINNPNISVKTTWTESSLKDYWKKNGMDQYEGIYEKNDILAEPYQFQVAVKREKDQYILIFLHGNYTRLWEEGDLKAELIGTATPNLFKSRWHLPNKRIIEKFYISFLPGFLNITWVGNSNGSMLLKLYPSAHTSGASNSAAPLTSSGSGFAISSTGYIVTNSHVVNGSNKILVRGINGDFSKPIAAEIVIEDRNNDLAILKINDPQFKRIGDIPYSFSKQVEDVGTNVFALGYPLRATMGG